MQARRLLRSGWGLVFIWALAAPHENSAKPPSSQPQDSGDHADRRVFSGTTQANAIANMLGSGFKSHGTDHFVVLSNADEKLTKDLVQRLERTYDSVHRFASQMDIRIDYPKDKLVVIFLRSREEFVEQYKKMCGGVAPPEHADGFYIGRTNVSLFYDVSKNHVMQEFAEKSRSAREAAKNATNSREKQAKLRNADWYDHRMLLYQRDENRSLVQHEVAHQLLYNLGVHNFWRGYQNPQWLVEGLATLFEPPPGVNGAGFNIVNQRRLGDVRSKIGTVGVKEFKTLISVGSLHNSMLSDDDYARSWAICYYLVKRKARQLPAFLESIKKCNQEPELSREQRIAGFETAFGPVNGNLIKDWKEFIDHLPYKPRW